MTDAHEQLEGAESFRMKLVETLKELGFHERFLEEYRELKMEVRQLQTERDQANIRDAELRAQLLVMASVHIERLVERVMTLEEEREQLQGECERLKLVLFSVARRAHVRSTAHPIERFTECNHNECEVVHEILGDMPHPTEEALLAALSAKGRQ